VTRKLDEGIVLSIVLRRPERTLWQSPHPLALKTEEAGDPTEAINYDGQTLNDWAERKQETNASTFSMLLPRSPLLLHLPGGQRARDISSRAQVTVETVKGNSRVCSLLPF
jgi:hypothetical protein